MAAPDGSQLNRLSLDKKTNQLDSFLVEIEREVARHRIEAIEEAEYLEKWIALKFWNQLADLFNSIAKDAETADEILGQLPKIAALISGTNRGQIYLVDNHQLRLVCRQAWGDYSDRFLMQPVTIKESDWNIIRVFENQEAEFIPDTNDPSKKCNKEICRETNLNSAVHLPIPSDLGERLGVLCFDNPPLLDDNKTFVNKHWMTSASDFLERISPALHKAKTIADYEDADRTVKSILSLGQNALTGKSEQEILHDLFGAAKRYKLDISLVMVRLVTGHENNRLRLAAYSPPDHHGHEFEAFLNQPDVATISIPSNHLKKRRQTIRKVMDIWDEDEIAKSDLPQLKDFLDRLLAFPIVDEVKIKQILRSHISIRMVAKGKWFGVCSFYTRVKRDFLDDELEILKGIVAETTAALRTVQVLRENKRKAKGHDLLRKCIEQVNNGATVGEIAELVVNGLHENVFDFEADLIACGWLDHAVEERSAGVKYQDGWRILAVHPQPSVEIEKHYDLSQGAMSNVVKTGKPDIKSIGDDGFNYHLPLIEDMRTSAVFPMKSSDGVIGALSLKSTIRDALTADDVDVINTIAGQLPIAVKNAKQTEALKRKAQMEALGENAAITVHRWGRMHNSMPNLISKALKLLKKEPIPLERIRINLETAFQGALGNQDATRGLKATFFGTIAVESFCPTQRVNSIIERSSQDHDNWKQVAITCDPNFDVQVDSDKRRYDEIIYSLVSNGVRHALGSFDETGLEPKVTVAIKELNDYVQTDVVDSGRGVPMRKRGNLFDGLLPLSEYHNLGLGLLICRKLAHRLQGTVELVESPDPNWPVEEFLVSKIRTRFRLTLPIKMFTEKT